MAAVVYLAPGPFGAGGQFFDNSGIPLTGGLINTYAAGTTTTTSTYTSSLGTVANANPIVLNSAGRIAGEVWLPQGIAMKFAVVDSLSNLIQTYDNLYGINDPTTVNGIGVTGATVSGALIMNAAPINEAQGANIPVAAQINLTTATGNYLSLTGTGTVTAIQLSQGAYRELVVNTVSAAFASSATLALVGGASFTPAVGDILGFRGEAAPVVRQVLYQPAAGVFSATKTQQTNATVTNAFVSPGTQQFHPSAAKAWVMFDSTGTIRSNLNVTSVTRNGAGNYTVNWTTPFSNTSYAVMCSLFLASAPSGATTFTAQVIASQLVGSVNVAAIRQSDFTQQDPSFMYVAAYGLQ